MLRLALGLPLVGLLTLLLGVPAILGGLLDPTGRFPHAVVRAWGRMILGLAGVRVRVEGAENIPPGPVVFAANHASALDIPIVFGHLPASFRVVHKRSLYLIPVVGWYLWCAGHVGIDRARAFRARRSLAAAARRIRGGTSVVLFPEGTRSRDGEVGLFKRGSFVLALSAGVPIVPVSLVGVRRVIPRGVLTLRPGAVLISVHPPLVPAGAPLDDAEQLAEEVRKLVVSGCREARL